VTPATGSDQRTRLLRRLRGRRFERIRFPGWDAVVLRVPDDVTAPPPVVRDLVARRQPMRLYPVAGAHLVKWPYAGGAVPEGCTVEPGGWDHLHCDGCNRHIKAGRTLWQTARGRAVWLCPYCYRRVRQLEGADPRSPPD
jgi:hypothetical protein